MSILDLVLGRTLLNREYRRRRIGAFEGVPAMGLARERAGQRAHFCINAVGAATTGVALAIIVIAKFGEGAWITMLVIPCVIALLLAVRSYYDRLTKEQSISTTRGHRSFSSLSSAGTGSPARLCDWP